MSLLQGLLLSDIHCEHMSESELDEAIEKLFGDGILEKVDLVFLCGDIGTVKEKEKLIKLLSHIGSRAELTLWAPGNHEYKGTVNPSKDFQEIATKSSPQGKIVLLDREKLSLVRKNGKQFAILGATLWSDLSHTEERFHKRDIHMTMEERQRLHLADKDFIIKTLENSQPKTVIVLTHHPPYYFDRSDKLKQYYGTEDPELTRVIGKAMFWCHGHVHEQVKSELMGTKIYLNSTGYKKESLPFKRLVIVF